MENACKYLKNILSYRGKIPKPNKYKGKRYKQLTEKDLRDI